MEIAARDRSGTGRHARGGDLYRTQGRDQIQARLYRRQQQGAGIGASDLLMPLQRVEPVYPYRAQQAGIEGSVTLRFSVDADGRVQDVEVVEAKPKRQFERAAIQAINKWRYQPRPGATDKLVQVITLKFKLES